MNNKRNRSSSSSSSSSKPPRKKSKNHGRNNKQDDKQQIAKLLESKKLKIINHGSNLEWTSNIKILISSKCKHDTLIDHNRSKDENELETITLKNKQYEYLYFCNLCYSLNSENKENENDNNDENIIENDMNNEKHDNQSNSMQVWSGKTSSGNLLNHLKKRHEMVQDKVEWTKEERLALLEPTLDWIAVDRNSINAVTGIGLDVFLTAIYNLGCQRKTEVKTLKGLLFHPGTYSKYIEIDAGNILNERKDYFDSFLGDKGNYPYALSMETDFWKSLSQDDYINLISRTINEEGDGIIIHFENLAEWQCLLEKAIIVLQQQYKEMLELNDDDFEKVKEKLDEIKMVRDEMKKKIDKKNKKKMNKNKLYKYDNNNNEYKHYNNGGIRLLGKYSWDETSDTDDDPEEVKNLVINNDTLSKWFVADSKIVDWKIGSDMKKKLDDEYGDCNGVVGENEFKIEIKMNENDNKNENVDGYDVKKDIIYQKTMKNISRALESMMGRIGINFEKDKEMMLEIIEAVDDWTYAKINLHTDNAVCNIDDWNWFLNHLKCFNHNISLVATHALELTKDQHAR